jgi:hypothetical protein
VGVPVPPEQIQIGSLGNLDTNGELVVVLPDNDPDVITPMVLTAASYGAVVSVTRSPFLSQCVATNPVNRARTDLGVAEVVNLYFQTKPKECPEINCTGGSVTNPAGPGKVPNYWIFTAPSNAAVVTVTAKFQGATWSKDFNILEPTGVDHADLMGVKNDISPGSSGVGMYLRPFIGPTNVSFYRVQIQEVGTDATNIWGFFCIYTNLSDWPTNLSHTGHGAGSWGPLKHDNSWIYGDQAEWSLSSATTTSGGFEWNIPGRWKVGSGPTNDMAIPWVQSFSCEGSGAMTINKFGHSATRQLNGQYTNVR